MKVDIISYHIIEYINIFERKQNVCHSCSTSFCSSLLFFKDLFPSVSFSFFGMSWPSPPLRTQRVQEHTRAPAKVEKTTQPTTLDRKQWKQVASKLKQRSGKKLLDKIQ